MTENPYSAPSGSDLATYVTPLPTLPEAISVSFRIDQPTYRRAVKKCQPLSPPDPRTGKRPHQTSAIGNIIILVLFLVFIPVGLAIPRQFPLNQIDRVLFWLCVVAVPYLSVIGTLVDGKRQTNRMSGFRPHEMENYSVEFGPHNITTRSTDSEGYVHTAVAAWSHSQIAVSDDAWFFNRTASPLIVPKSVLTVEQHQCLEEFVDRLLIWQKENQSALKGSEPTCLPDIPQDAIPFAMHSEAVKSYVRKVTGLRRMFPECLWDGLPFWFWCALLILNIAASLVHPMYRLSLSAPVGYIAFGINGIAIWLFVKIIRSFSGGESPVFRGGFTRDELWYRFQHVVSHGPIERFRDNAVVDDMLLINIRKNELLSVTPAEAFSSREAFETVSRLLSARRIE